ncbi:MAG: hypothetical protein JWP81_3209 [Ferruginibacter sp.]|nr:hypothetical protein [Ferruginibacter sp.]
MRCRHSPALIFHFQNDIHPVGMMALPLNKFTFINLLLSPPSLRPDDLAGLGMRKTSPRRLSKWPTVGTHLFLYVWNEENKFSYPRLPLF